MGYQLDHRHVKRLAGECVDFYIEQISLVREYFRLFAADGAPGPVYLSADQMDWVGMILAGLVVVYVTQPAIQAIERPP